MPRQQRRAAAPSRSAPARPVAAPPRPAQPAQSRPASTMAHPPATTSQARPPAQAQQQSPGLFGQMASTAAGVAVGSSIGHAIGGLFGGGSSSAPAESPQSNTPAVAASQDNAYTNNSWGARSCETDAKQFTKCMDDYQGNMQICGWYLEQLKACQAAASQY